MVNILSHWENANPNCNAVSLTTCYHQKDQKYHAVEYMERKEPLDAAGGKVEWYSQYAKLYLGSSKN